MKLSQIIPEYLRLRFTIEQMSLLDLAADDMITELYRKIEDAKHFNDDTVNIKACERRVRVLRRAQRVIREAIDI